jgi:hypothetical protein
MMINLQQRVMPRLLVQGRRSCQFTGLPFTATTTIRAVSTTTAVVPTTVPLLFTATTTPVNVGLLDSILYTEQQQGRGISTATAVVFDNEPQYNDKDNPVALLQMKKSLVL